MIFKIGVISAVTACIIRSSAWIDKGGIFLFCIFRPETIGDKCERRNIKFIIFCFIFLSGRITRLMAVLEDYESLDHIGPVRSSRDYFVYVAMGYQG